MLIKRPADIPASEITPRDLFDDRRRFLQQAGASLIAGAALWHGVPDNARAAATRLSPLASSPFSTTESQTAYKSVTTYNNFYEFGTDKEDPARNAGKMAVRPWTVRVEGLAGKPRTFDIDDLLKLAPLEERIYRLRCVEAWSMVIPWLGFPLAKLLNEVEPTSAAKYVRFETVQDREHMPGLNSSLFPWPYVEGLRLDEAMNDLAILSTGLYGEALLPQNGAPIRLVVPWKYGFKSIKSIVKIDLVDTMPESLWMKTAPNEYGFYATVNPNVDHPRWSQATERRIGAFGRRETLLFNGYGEFVAHLYDDPDFDTTQTVRGQ